MIWDVCWPQETFAWYLDDNEAAAMSPSGTVAAPTHCHCLAGPPYWCGAAPRLPAPPLPTRHSPSVSLRPGSGVCAALWWRIQALSQVTDVIKVERVSLCGSSLSFWVPLVFVGSSLSLSPHFLCSFISQSASWENRPETPPSSCAPLFVSEIPLFLGLSPTCLSALICFFSGCHLSAFSNEKFHGSLPSWIHLFLFPKGVYVFANPQFMHLADCPAGLWSLRSSFLLDICTQMTYKHLKLELSKSRLFSFF